MPPPPSAQQDPRPAPLGTRVAAAISVLLQAVARASERANLNPFATIAAQAPVDADVIGRELHDELLCVALRVVFIAHAESRGLLPVSNRHYDSELSLKRLRVELSANRQDAPEAMTTSFSGWQRLRRLFVAVHDGYRHKSLILPARGGVLFGAATCGWVDGSNAPPVSREQWIDDGSLLAFIETLWLHGTRKAQQALDIRDIGSVYESAMGGRVVEQGAYQWGLDKDGSRRSTGSHYTPEELTRPIVERALAAHVASGAIDEAQRLLNLRICDLAMGSGAFLVEACVQLAELVARAWQNSGNRRWALIADDEIAQRARRLVAVQCLYGVDINPLAVELAKLSLWLVTEAADQPFTFLDHCLKRGDSLLGLTLDQLVAEDLSAPPQPPPKTIATELCAAADKRREAQQLILSADANPLMYAARRRMLREADALLQPLQSRADALAASFFNSAPKRRRTGSREQAAKSSGAAAAPEFFHWPLVFPEIFSANQGRGGFDVAIGNPPFLGGKRISTEHGQLFAAWLRAIHQSSKNMDLSAHFVRRAAALCADSATIAMITTNTLPQGDTRRDSLALLLAHGWQIYHAVRSMDWPGDAAVQISIACLAHGVAANAASTQIELDGQSVNQINSLLRPGSELSEPQRLADNAGLCFIGCFLRGTGFVLSEEEGAPLHAAEPDVVRPFLGGDEVNNTPSHTPHRYVIDFSAHPLEEARRFPKSFAIIEERVAPVRASLPSRPSDLNHKRRWWQFANTRPEMRQALANLPRCLVAARVTKHLCFAFQPTDRVFSDQLCVFAANNYATFAVLQSRIHDAWVRRYASTFGEGLRYSPSDCVETFPFPASQPLKLPADLAHIGETLYAARAELMQSRQLGFTCLYNELREPTEAADDELAALNELHQVLDETVLTAYGWEDLAVPPYHRNEDTRAAETRFYQRLIERLHALNVTRAMPRE